MERASRTGWLAAAALAAVLTLAVGREVLFAGKTFTPTDFLTARAPWGEPHVSDASIRNRTHQDVIEYDAMHAIAAGQSLRRGELLLWNPQILCGVASAGDPQLGTFYPLRMAALRLLPPLSAMDALALLHFFGAGLAMFALARTWGLSPAASLVASLTWMVCGQQMVWFKYGGGSPAAVYLPLLALALRRATRDRSIPWMAAAGAFWALLLVSSHPQLSFLALVWTAGVLACNLRARGVRWTLASGAVFSLFAAGLSAVQLFPFLESLLASQKLSTRDSLIYARPARVPLLLVTLFWQRAMGSPIDRLDMTNPWTGSNFFEFQGYMGLLPLLLACAAWRREKKVAAAALALLGAATFYPLWWLIVAVLPFLRMVDPHRLYLFAFAASILAGTGFDAFLEKPPSRRLVLGCALVAAAVLLAGVVGPLKSTWISFRNPAYFSLIVAAMAALSALWTLTSSVSPGLKTAAALLAIGADLLPGFLAYNSAYDPLPPEPAAFRRLPRGERVLVDLESPYYKMGVSNYLMAYGLSTPSGYVSQYPRAYGELVRALGGKAGDRRVEFGSGNTRALRALGVGAPRARLVGRCETISAPEDRLRRLADPAFDPARVAILETTAPPLSGDPAGSVERTGEREYLTSSDRPSLLVVAETHDPGWRCEVDGVPRPVVRANHAQQAVALEPGRHRVAFSYRPVSLSPGLGCTAAAGALLLGYLIFAATKRLRPPGRKIHNL